MKEKIKENKTGIIIVGLALLISVIGSLVFMAYTNYHSAPYYASNKAVTLEDSNSDTHKLNKLQKSKFIKITQNAIDEKEGGLEWSNFDTKEIDVYKHKQPQTYAVIYKVKPNVSSYRPTISFFVTYKLENSDLKEHDDEFKIEHYYSDLSDIMDLDE